MNKNILKIRNSSFVIRNYLFYCVLCSVFCVLHFFSGCVPGNAKSNLPKFVNINIFANKKTNYIYNIFTKKKLTGSLIITEEFKNENNTLKYKLSGEYKKENSLIADTSFNLSTNNVFFLENFKKEIQHSNTNKQTIQVMVNNEQKIALISGTIKNTKSLTIKLNEQVFENDSILMILQYIDFNELQKVEKNKIKTYILPVLISQLGAISHLNLQFEKISTEKINNKNLPCYLISLSLFGEKKNYACYAKNGSRHTLFSYSIDNYKFILNSYNNKIIK